MAAIVTGWLLVAFGAFECAGGVLLYRLGGTPAYAVMGFLLVVAGVLLVLRRAAALATYAALLVATLAWALWEAGLDRWALVPRGALLAVAGIWLLAPPVHRAIATRGEDPRRTVRGARRLDGGWRGARGALAVAMAAVVATAIASLFSRPFDIAGTLDRAAVATTDRISHVAGDDWTAYGGGPYGQRYSRLADITPETVGGLEMAWTYHTGEAERADDPHERTFEVTPLKIGELLYFCTVRQHVVALDAASGARRWEYDPHITVGHSSQHLTCRGLAYDDVAATQPGLAHAAPSDCPRRLFLPTIDARLIALDAATGTPCAGFGVHGQVDLKAGMPFTHPGYYMQTSPPVVAHGLVIVGGSIDDNLTVLNPSGVIRAFDALTGALAWNFDPGNPGATKPLPAGRQYTSGAPNNWAPASVDPDLGLVYLGLGNRSPDQLGAGRSPEVERFSSAIVALDVDTGALRWVFQAVHHDLWDRDIPAQPSLVDLSVDGATVPALVAPTKQGDVYVLDRRTGKPILPVHETPAPSTSIPGEFTSPTQPVSALSFTPPPLTGRDMWGATPLDQLACRIRLRKLGYDGAYTAPSTRPTLVYPGNLGVFNWGGVAIDPVHQAMIGTPARLAFTYQLVARPDDTSNVVSDGSPEHWNENYGARYAVKIEPFLSPIGLPCQAPPWGAIAGADLPTGKVAWRHRNGTVRDQMPSFLPIPFPMGTASLGGPLVTAGGVAFYSGTMDDYLRAYDMRTGRVLWRARLPAGGQATPMTYRANGRQMVVVAAGGHGSFGTRLGDAVVAYALR